ncbi:MULTISPECIES: hypothetical protein [Saccharothrix]|uniref:hypothetical protein n=1 Tax=Saccharothrix TaxID=2071 RepID=UPI001161015F|nr:hypothetical protein [Saccharothrix sp. CB00851]
MKRRLSAVLMLGVAALLAACTGGGGDTTPSADATGAQDVPQIEQAIPEKYRGTATAFAAFRAIDACGMHDVEAAKQVTGDKGDKILPDQDGLHLCTLEMHKSELESTWTFDLEVGALFESAARSEAAPETVGGMQVFTRETDRGCSLSKPLDDTHAVELRTSTFTGATKKPCDVVREYAAKLAPIWNDPPKRGSGVTSPTLDLASMDPCTAAAAVLETAGPGSELRPSGVFGCSVTPAVDPNAPPQKTRTDTSVEFVMDEDPASLVKAGIQTAREIMIDRFRGVVNERSTGCITYVVWDPDTAVAVDQQSEDAFPALQLIRVEAPDCDRAQAAARKVMAKVGSR